MRGPYQVSSSLSSDVKVVSIFWCRHLLDEVCCCQVMVSGHKYEDLDFGNWGAKL